MPKKMIENEAHQKRQATEQSAGAITPSKDSALHEPIQETLGLVDQVAKIFASSLKSNLEYDRFAEALSSLVKFDRVNINILDKASKTYTVKYISGLCQPSRHIGD